MALEFASPEMTTYPQQIFTLINFAVLPFWGLMIFAPKWEVTRNTMTSTWPILLCGAMHLSMVAYGLSQPGSLEEFEFLATQGFVKLSAMQEMRQYPVFVSEASACSIEAAFSEIKCNAFAHARALASESECLCV